MDTDGTIKAVFILMILFCTFMAGRVLRDDDAVDIGGEKIKAAYQQGLTEGKNSVRCRALVKTTNIEGRNKAQKIEGKS